MSTDSNGKENRNGIGILGGTFDPIHYGHLAIAKQAYEEYKLQKVLIIPSGISYLKAGQNVSSARDRYRMCLLAAEGITGMTVSDLEIRRDGNTYTYETLQELAVLYQGQELTFIVGADTLFSIKNWKYPERIFQSCRILAAVRGEKGPEDLEKEIVHLQDTYQARVELLHMKETDVSSSMIRERIRNGMTVEALLPKSVREYIVSHKLYLQEE